MADIKTDLRELSVATTVGLLIKNIDFSIKDFYCPKEFFSLCSVAISNFIYSKDYTKFNFSSNEIRIILNNGYRLGLAIYNNNNFSFNSNNKVLWVGNSNTRNDPTDIFIGQYPFSLKEESFILENMGLYKLLNCYTGSNYSTRHIFKDYAKTEYDNWFLVSWKELIKYLNENNNIWKLENYKKEKYSQILLSDNSVILKYKNKGNEYPAIELPLDCTLDDYERRTNANIRENVFSKFINRVLEKNSLYQYSKKKCAEVASSNLVNELKSNLNYDAGLPRFLRIHQNEYYYAKTTLNSIEIYKVPSLSEFKNKIKIESIVPFVPKSQANIITTIKNIGSGKTLILRNECRFSHGQFNGTPEAKMYYVNNGSLIAIYDLILKDEL